MFFALPLAALIASVAAESSTSSSYAKTASINGFADDVFADLPTCAQECVKEDTSITPCPYWDTGCLCVMSTWTSLVTACYAENCSGEDAQDAYDVSVAACKAAGVWSPYWIINAAASSSLEAAIGTYTEASSTTAGETSTATATTEETTTTTGEVTSATSATAAETAAAETSSEAATSAAEATSAAASSEASSESAAATSSAAVSSYEGGANGVVPAAAIGFAAGIAMLI